MTSFSNKTIEALKMAVREMTDAIPHLDIHFDDYFEAINACKEALASLESDALAEAEKQAPLAWIKTVELLYIKAHKAEGIKHWKTNLGLKPEPDDSPLYTHPATWQSLSDLEVAFIAEPFYDDDNLIVNEFGFARAIEQALKEKNT